MLTQPLITDPATGEQFSRDVSVPGSLYTRYVPGATPPATSTPSPSPAPDTSSSASSPLDDAQEAYYKGLDTTVNPDAIREGVRARMQGQIDATNVLYQNLIADQTVENGKQNDRTRAINVSAGLGGSDFASANAAETEKAGAGAIAALKREQASKVAVILGNIDQRAYDETKDATANARQNLKDKVDYYAQRATAAKEDLKTLANSGVALEQLSSDQYSKLLKQSGMDEFAFKLAYNGARKAASKVDYTWKVAGGKIFGYGLDPLTGKISTIEQDVPGGIPSDYKPTVLDNGTVLFYPDTLDPSKPVKDQILTYNSGVVKKSADSATASRLSPATAAMDSLRDAQSGYVEPKAYADMYTTYLSENPGKGKEFLDQFPVSIYISPEERSKFSNTGY